LFPEPRRSIPFIGSLSFTGLSVTLIIAIINEAYEAALKILKSGNPPTAIFATDDIKAIGAYKAILELGLKIPDDISLIGHNNYDISQITTPPLTTIDVPILELGRVATQKLIDVIEGETPPVRTILETKFIIRDSCRKLEA